MSSTDGTLPSLIPPPVGESTRAGESVLDDVAAALRKYVAFPSEEAADAVALWVAHTHFIDHLDSTPRLAVTSAEKGSGKTRLFEVLRNLVRRPRYTVNMTPAVFFRLIDQEAPTLLIDEADTIFGAAAKPQEELRGFINGGFRRGAEAYRMVCDGAAMRVGTFRTFAPVALAGIGNLPDTISDRAVNIRLRKRALDEPVHEWRDRWAEPELQAIQETLAAWADDVGASVQEEVPVLPPGLRDRVADVWEPLIVIADLAGGHWPATGRRAAVHVARTPRTDPTIGVRLLRDLRTVFDATGRPDIFTEDLLSALSDLPDSYWTSYRGHPLDAKRLAALLLPYDITPKRFRIGEDNMRGYRRHQFEDAWRRYVPSAGTSGTPGTSATPVPPVPHVPDDGDTPEGRVIRLVTSTFPGAEVVESTEAPKAGAE